MFEPLVALYYYYYTTTTTTSTTSTTTTTTTSSTTTTTLLTTALGFVGFRGFRVGPAQVPGLGLKTAPASYSTRSA